MMFDIKLLHKPSVIRCLPRNIMNIKLWYLLGADSIVAMVCIADSPKAEAEAAVSFLKHMGIKVAMLTGDNTRTAWAIAQQVCIFWL